MSKLQKVLEGVVVVAAFVLLAVLPAESTCPMMPQSQMGTQSMHRGGMMGGGWMMGGWWMMWPNAGLKVENVKDGAALSLTSSDAQTAKLIQDHAQWMKQMWLHRQAMMSQGGMMGMMGQGGKWRGGMMGGWWMMWQNVELAVENVKDGAKLTYTSQDADTAKKIQEQAGWMKEEWQQRQAATTPAPEKKT